MSELQATLEFSVELHKFYNVDLFQRGFYQIRCNLKSSPKVPAKVEVSLPRTKKSDLIFPPSIINGVAVSKTFQILYRNEEVSLDDVIQYRVHIILDSAKIEETLRNADFSLDVELWFSEDGLGMEQHSSIQNVSRRQLQISFVPSRGLHYHLPVLFDYFHLCCVSLSLHGSLISLHQPYIASPRSGNKRNKSRTASPSLSTLESVLFGQAQLGVKYGTSRTRLAIGCRIYQEVCTLLLQSLESLQLSLQHLSGLIPDLQRPSVRIVDCRKRMKKLIEVAQGLETEEDFLLKANSDISQLCAENILLWNKFLDAFTLREVIRRHLAQVSHSHRLRRFAEGFFTMTNPRKSALCCLDAKHQHYTLVTEAVRKSAYFTGLPDLTVSCKDLDGTHETLPIIFEDIYSDGVPKRNIACDGLRSAEGEKCVIVSSVCSSEATSDPVTMSPASDYMRSSSRPSSLSEEADGVSREHNQFLGDFEKRDTKNNRKFVNHKKVAKKKTSLPVKLTEERLTSTLPTEAKSKSERKRSMDSALNILSPTLSPDMKGYFKEKFKSNLRFDAKPKNKSKDKKTSEIKNLRGQTGYSHLEWCSNVPYNLEEEPELVDGMKHPKTKNEHELSFTSQVLKEESNQTGSIVDHYYGSHLETLDENETLEKETSRLIKTKPREELEGMAKVRDIVLKNSKKKREEESSDSSLSEASGWVSNNSRRSSLSTTDTNSDNISKERSKSLIETKSPVVISSKKFESDLKSPGLLLSNKNCRSRSEEPSKKALSPSPVLQSRPRHRSECGPTRSYSPVRKFPPPHSPILMPGNRRHGHQEGKPDNKNVALPPPAEFRDPPKDVKLDNAVRENNFSKVRHKKCSDALGGGFQTQEVEAPDIRVESEEAIQRLYEAVSEITADKKMSRSNTISFGDEGMGSSYEESSSEMRRRKMTSSEIIVSQRMSSSMQAIDGRLPDTVTSLMPSRSLHHDHLSFTCCDWIPNKSVLNDEKMMAKIAYLCGMDLVNFICSREEFKKLTSFPGALYSDRANLSHALPYFTKVPDSLSPESSKSTHLVICVHGLDGNSADLRLVKTYMEMAMPSSNLDFLMSEINQADTFLSIEDMTKKLVNEIIYHVKTSDTNIGRISFIGHSLGCILIRSAIQKPELVAFSSKFHTYLSLSGPHLGTMYNNSNLGKVIKIKKSGLYKLYIFFSVNAGMWVMQRWKKSGSLQQLALKDHSDIRQTFMYKLSENSNLHLFKSVLLAGSSQDKYVPIHSARVELCKSAVKDNSVVGEAYKEMVNNVLGKVSLALF